MTIRLAGMALSASLLFVVASGALAQSYPTKPIRMVVPFPPGGTSDTVARIIAEKLARNLGQQVVLDNRGGAAGNIGAEIVAKAIPDGYTLILGTGSTLTINPSLYGKVPFNSEKDFAPVTLVVLSPNILVVNPLVPATSVKELIALAKAKPGQLNYASAGSGGTAHLAGVLFNIMAGIDMAHIPYRGSGPATSAVLGGQVQVQFAAMPSVMPQVKAGRLRALGVASLQRSPGAPNIPTIAESGLPGFDVSAWHAVLAPAGTSKEVVTRLHTEIVKIVHMADVRERFIGLGADPVGSTPEQLAAQISDDLVKWAKVVKASGARVD